MSYSRGPTHGTGIFKELAHGLFAKGRNNNKLQCAQPIFALHSLAALLFGPKEHDARLLTRTWLALWPFALRRQSDQEDPRSLRSSECFTDREQSPTQAYIQRVSPPQPFPTA